MLVRYNNARLLFNTINVNNSIFANFGIMVFPGYTTPICL